jgi:ABC-type Na+ efflux pump permease subunit
MFQKKLVTYPLIAVLVLGAGYALGLRFDHPHSGLKNALGSATSSVALYRHNANYDQGSIVVVNTGDKEVDPALARVSNVSPDGVDIQSGAQIQRVQATAVKGELLVIIPFIGALLSLVGL